VKIDLRTDMLASRDIEGHDTRDRPGRSERRDRPSRRRRPPILCASPDYLRRHERLERRRTCASTRWFNCDFRCRVGLLRLVDERRSREGTLST
jgi:hypothetical protein